MAQIIDRRGHCIECPPCLGSHAEHCPAHRTAIAHDPDYCDAHRPRGWTCNQPHAAGAMAAELPPFGPVRYLADNAPTLDELPPLCFCDGPWHDIEPADRPETTLEREHVRGSIVNTTARCVYADELPAGATIEPWTDEDDTEALAASASVLWPVLIREANAWRRRAYIVELEGSFVDLTRS